VNSNLVYKRLQAIRKKCVLFDVEAGIND